MVGDSLGSLIKNFEATWMFFQSPFPQLFKRPDQLVRDKLVATSALRGWGRFRMLRRVFAHLVKLPAFPGGAFWQVS